MMLEHEIAPQGDVGICSVRCDMARYRTDDTSLQFFAVDKDTSRLNWNNAMASVPVPNGVKVEMIYTILSTRMQNVYWVTNGSPATGANLVTLWTLFRDWENVTAKAQRGNGCSLVLITLTAMDGPGGAFYEAPVSPAIQGGIGSAMLPASTSLACKHVTGKQGRSYRGRSYWIGSTQTNQLNADQCAPAFAAAIVTIYNTLRASLLSAGWQFCIASLYSGVDGDGRAVPRASGILTPITATSVELGWDTQRHRKAPPVV